MSATEHPIRTGLIGFGLSGQIFHNPFLQHHPDFELVTVSSSQTDSVNRLAPGARVTDNERLLDDPGVELVIITAPNEHHFPLAMTALNKGKHVLLEKPSVTEREQIDRLIRAAESADRLVTVYQNRRYDGDFLRLKALIDDGSLGDLKVLDSYYDRFRPAPRDRWRERPGIGAGIFWDLGPHLADQALALFGLPEAVTGSLRALRPGSETTDWFRAELWYPGHQVTLRSSPFVAGEITRFTAGFTGGSWHCLGLDGQETLLRAGHPPASDHWAAGLAPAQTATRRTDQDTATEHIPPGDYRHFFARLAQAIRGNGPPPVSAGEARQLVHLLCAIEESSIQGRRLTVS